MLQISQLPNKLKIATYKMPINSISLSIAVKVGSRYEQEDENGITHFLEHMAFKGTKNRTAKELSIEFDNAGGRFNAYTSKEFTVYHGRFLPHHLNKAMDLFSDIIQNSLFLPAEMDKELNVICQEIAQSHDDPEDVAFENLQQAIYPNHPLGRSILGTEEVLRKITPHKLEDFMAKFYTAENMVISAAGNINHDDFLAMCNQYFQNLRTNKVSKSIEAVYCPSTYTGIHKELEQNNIFIAFPGISYMDQANLYHAQMLSTLLSGGYSSRLFQRIREELGLAYSVGAGNISYENEGTFYIYSSTTGDNIDLLYKEISHELLGICSNITEIELQRIKDQITSSILLDEENASYKADKIAKDLLRFGKVTSVEEIKYNINNTNLSNLHELAKSIFHNRKPNISIIGTNTDLKSWGEVC